MINFIGNNLHDKYERRSYFIKKFEATTLKIQSFSNQIIARYWYCRHYSGRKFLYTTTTTITHRLFTVTFHNKFFPRVENIAHLALPYNTKLQSNK